MKKKSYCKKGERYSTLGRKSMKSSSNREKQPYTSKSAASRWKLIDPLIKCGSRAADAKQLKKKPSIETALKEVLEGEIAGDSMGNQRWIRKSLGYLAQSLQQRGYEVSQTTVRRLLKKLGYKLFSNRKSLAPQHPDRDKQFHFIRRMRKVHIAFGRPVLSIDAKKKELISNFKNARRTWGNVPITVKDHDFPSAADGKVTPYGIYDIIHNLEYVYVGTSYDTLTFAVYAIARWWNDPKRPQFKNEDKLLILCDAGGSNSCRYWRWKIEVQRQLADKYGIEVTVCHYPTGTSKWNPIEHRLFSEISKNWAGKPLQTFETVINYIQDTATKIGLVVKAFLIEQIFEKGLQYDQKERDNLNLRRYRLCPTWNYAIRPYTCST